MDRESFLKACWVIMEHDSRLKRINDYLRHDDEAFGDGMFTYLPSTDVKLRRLAIDLLSASCGLEPKGSTISYFFDECLIMRGGGSQTYPEGKTFKLQTAEDLWTAVEYEMHRQ